ncbi:hypothetical protein PT974_10275 [Cladobotryum mycophilum]|uniref:Uncharacterized protein n=1 Tax=Cladobotryum mycophilum TaxID=491253 RepID=A0ABR0SAG1_9HYPO
MDPTPMSVPFIDRSRRPAWLQGSTQTSGKRHFEGFHIYKQQDVDAMKSDLPDTYKTVLTQVVVCDLEV